MNKKSVPVTIQGFVRPRLFRDEIAIPLGLEFYIGLPAVLPNERMATLVPPGPREIRASVFRMPLRMIVDQFILKDSLLARAWAQPDISLGIDHTLRENRDVEMPSKNGFRRWLMPTVSLPGAAGN